MASKTLASLIVRIGADVTGVTAGMNTLEKRTRSLKKQFGSVKDSVLSWRAALGVLAGAAGIGIAAKKIFDLGAAVEETSSKFSTVFGASTQRAQKFLDEFANTAGLTNVAGQELLATTGAIAQGMGMSQTASASFAEAITRLSGDLSSFNNIPIAETSRAIQSALTGERESLKRLGIVILETDVQKKALAMTGKGLAAELTQEEKATATLALITERAGVAVGDLARTMESPANRARKLAAEFLDLRDSIAKGLLPAFGVVLEELGESVGGFDGLGRAVESNGAKIAAWTRFTIESFKAVAMAIAAPIRIAFNLGEVIGKVLTAAIQAMTGNFAGAKKTLGSIVGDFGDMRDSVANVISGFDDMRVASGEAWQTMQTGAARAVTATQQVAAAQAALAAGMGGGVNVPIHLLTGPSPGLLTTDFRPDLRGFKDSMREMRETAVDTFGSMRAQVDMFGDRFADAIAEGVMKGKFQFRDFANFVIAELIRIQAQKLVAGAIGFFASLASGGAIGAAGLGGGTPPMGLGASIGPSISSNFGPAPASPTVINQTISFNVSAIDSRDAARFVWEQKGTIAGVVAEAARSSMGYRRALAGA